jgi:hypothetical protein
MAAAAAATADDIVIEDDQEGSCAFEAQVPAPPPSPPPPPPDGDGKRKGKRKREGGGGGGDGDGDGDGGWEGFGGYMAAKNRKLRAQFAAEFAGARAAGSGGALSGVTAWVDGATRPPRERLRTLLGENGGALETYLGAGVTHVVCERLADATRVRLRKRVRTSGLKVVTPLWVVRCVEEGRRLPEAGFEVAGMGDPGQANIASFFGRRTVGRGGALKK